MAAMALSQVRHTRKGGGASKSGRLPLLRPSQSTTPSNCQLFPVSGSWAKFSWSENLLLLGSYDAHCRWDSESGLVFLFIAAQYIEIMPCGRFPSESTEPNSWDAMRCCKHQRWIFWPQITDMLKSDSAQSFYFYYNTHVAGQFRLI